MRVLAALGHTLLVVVSSPVVFSQSLDEVPKFTDVHRLAGGESAQDVTRGPLAGTCDYAEAKVREACVAAQVVAFNYSAEAILHRRDVLDWQLFAGKMIFVVVALLVLSGLGFAYLQFRNAAKVALKRPKNGQVDSPVADLELGLQKIRVSSSILGVIILGFSMAFFYLYLVYVFPIVQLGGR